MASSTAPTPYIHAAPAAQLASDSRPICLSSSVIHALNCFLDETLLSILSLAGPGSVYFAQMTRPALSPEEQTVRLPLQTIHFKDGLLAFFARAKGNNQTLARDAILEAELEVREWIRTKGHRSDPALAISSLSREASHASTLDVIPDDPSSQRRASVGILYEELRLAISGLSSLGARSAFHNSAGARAAAASNLAVKSQLQIITPLLAVYASCVLNHLAAYLVKGCARVVERDPSSSEAKLQHVLELMGEDPLLTDVWRIMVRSPTTIALPETDEDTHRRSARPC